MSTSPEERIARPLERRTNAPAWPGLVFGVALLGAAVSLADRRFGWDLIGPWMFPTLAFLVGLALVWSPLDDAVTGEGRRPDIVVGMFARENSGRVLVGIGLAGAALVWFSQWKFTEQPVLRAVIVYPAILVGVALVFAPWWMRLIRQVGVERMERVREFERAEIAAHLHDSVLQTLTLIRKNASDADMVARLARAQERDLRAYLYQDRRTEAGSVATALAVAIAQVEDSLGIAIETVTVGDAPTDSNLRAAVAAVKEAASNAARHGVPPISVYAEVKPDSYEVFVRDSGPGFAPKRVPADRLGIKESIHGRVTRHGGTATVASKPGTRTEVHVAMPRRAESAMSAKEATP